MFTLNLSNIAGGNIVTTGDVVIRLIGNITGDTFNVNAPNADVFDETTGGTINIIDADNNSYHYNGTSSIVWRDTNGGRFVNDKVTPVNITIAAGTQVTLNGNLGVVTAEGNATVTLQPNTTVEELAIEAGTVTVDAPEGAIEQVSGNGSVTVAQEITHVLNLDENTVGSSLVQFGSDDLTVPSFLSEVEAGEFDFKLVYNEEQSAALVNYYNTEKRDESWTSETTPEWFTYLLGTVPTEAADVDVNAMFVMSIDENGNAVIKDGTQLNSGDRQGSEAGMIIPNNFPSGTYHFVGTVGEFTVTVVVEIR